ncbi:MAG: hypothetical protein GX860_04670 [Alcaligenaceae bacterium]|nr:hypothetical protein [Alcaligenaceae bacterium]
MTRFSKLLVPALSVLLLAACGKKGDDPERDLTVVRFSFVNACTFYAGSKNANFCGCSFDEMVKRFGQDTVIRLGNVAEESDIENPDDVVTFRAMHEFIAATPEGVCKEFVVKESPKDGETETFFRKLIN